MPWCVRVAWHGEAAAARAGNRQAPLVSPRGRAPVGGGAQGGRRTATEVTEHMRATVSIPNEVEVLPEIAALDGEDDARTPEDESELA